MFKSTQDFRARAQEKDYTELKNYIDSLPKKTEGFPCDEYAFSYTSATTLLKEHSGITQSGPVFTIGKLPNEKKITRSMVLSESIISRIDQLSAEYWQYSKRAVLHQLLDEALRKYGY